ncbi:MAG: hypothetical protein VX945_00865 [Verrucomicrobiota bacterium]|nr:hypothetical protein [Verrucomicrobiota bacterium]
MQTSKRVYPGHFRPNYTTYDEKETQSGFGWVEKLDEPPQSQSFCGFDQTTNRPAADDEDAVSPGKP